MIMAMNKERMTIARNRAYEPPFAEVIRLVPLMTVCGSNGNTENYGSGNIWELGEDNEG